MTSRDDNRKFLTWLTLGLMASEVDLEQFDQRAAELRTLEKHENLLREQVLKRIASPDQDQQVVCKDASNDHSDKHCQAVAPASVPADSAWIPKADHRVVDLASWLTGRRHLDLPGRIRR